jgi:hypothetical protein
MESEFIYEKCFLKFIKDNGLEITSELSSTDMYIAYGLKKKGVPIFKTYLKPTDFYICFMYNARGNCKFSFDLDTTFSEISFIQKVQETLDSKIKYRNWSYKWDLSSCI